MKKNYTKIRSCAIALLTFVSASVAQAEVGDTLWFQYNDRFCAPEIYDLQEIDSVVFKTASMRMYKKEGATGAKYLTKSYKKEELGAYTFNNPGRYIVKPGTYGNIDFTNENSKFCFQRSQESEHFICFWEKGLEKKANGNITLGGSTCNVNTMLRNAEKIWKVYVEELGFLEPGKSTTDHVKLEMFIVNQTDWRADGSGQKGTTYYYNGSTKTSREYRVGLFHCNPWASSSNVTVAHEIGHVFQYLVSADLGDSHGLNYGYNNYAQGGNEWWEDCANWQAHKVYPAQQFAENWSNNQNMHHMNILSENARYNNCYYQDWWCQLHGLNTVARVWRESTKPEDPIEAYMRIFGLDVNTFADEQFLGYQHIASMDIDRWQTYGQGLIGSEQQRLQEPTADIVEKNLGGDRDYWVVNPEYCPENYGYNANPMKIPAAGTVIKAHFKGIVGAAGYREIYPDRAGWRYGFVAYSSDGTRTYGEMGRDAEGDVTLTVPENCKNIWFVVMGAPTKYWRHPWDDNAANDEQWPYAVKFEGTDPYGANRTYGEYAEDYARRDTTVVINANLAYSSSSYSSVRVQYDMDAISKALGVSTAQMQALKRNTSTGTKGSLRFAAVRKNGSYYYNTTTTTSTDQCYGHWFTTAGDVTSYSTSAAIFAELYPDSYGCYVGQYPGRLRKGNTYVFRQAVIYTHTDGKEYSAVMEVHLTVN
ncbi:MAG: DUF4859 domain-containing protein [Bacteroidaceae bacterium]|nr:DUF4859 domain-containing protein [Bacteroidaceae bacterium]